MTLSLAQMMAQQTDPEYQEQLARYNNAQIAVDMAYRLGARYYSIPEKRIPNPDWKEGDASYEKHTYIDPTNEEKVAAMSDLARRLKIEIEKDLNATLEVLPKENKNAQTGHS